MITNCIETIENGDDYIDVLIVEFQSGNNKENAINELATCYPSKHYVRETDFDGWACYELNHESNTYYMLSGFESEEEAKEYILENWA